MIQKIISVTVEGRAKEAVPEKENISSEELKQEMGGRENSITGRDR